MLKERLLPILLFIVNHAWPIRNEVMSHDHGTITFLAIAKNRSSC